MALSVSTNTAAATAHRYLRTNDMEASRSLAKLSSGSRIVRASDDAASLAVGTKLKADVAVLKQAQVNASHGQSVLQVADGALQQVSDILIRMKALATQAVSGSISDTERGYLDSEFTQLDGAAHDISTQTKFNGTHLLDGTFTARLRGRHRPDRGRHHRRHRLDMSATGCAGHQPIRSRSPTPRRRPPLSTPPSATSCRPAPRWARRCRGSTSSAPISPPRSRTSTPRARR